MDNTAYAKELVINGIKISKDKAELVSEIKQEISTINKILAERCELGDNLIDLVKYLRHNKDMWEESHILANLNKYIKQGIAARKLNEDGFM